MLKTPIIMKKSVLFLFAFLITVVSFAQQERDLKLNKETNLIDVVYYHDNGVVSQTGSYTTDGKLQGVWLSFNTEGKKIVSANYDNGKKVGKWIYWIDGVPKEVDYSKNVASL
jgi:antitoxin component YwqK of YwqJK toxin-antitoxin module